MIDLLDKIKEIKKIISIKLDSLKECKEIKKDGNSKPKNNNLKIKKFNTKTKF